MRLENMLVVLKREYLETNPLGTIPLLIDGDSRLTESAAICQYLAVRHSPRELAVAAGEHGTRFVLVTGVMLPSKGKEQWIDNVLASPQGAITGEKFELFEAAFVGAGDTLAAALAALLASGAELSAAVGEALQFLDQSLDAGFRPPSARRLTGPRGSVQVL